MKKLSLFILIILAFHFSKATVLTVSNTAAYPAQYASISAAVAAANTGDTIYVYSSSTGYLGPVTVNKRLVIIGGGVNPQRVGLVPTTYGNSSGTGAFTFTAPGADGSVITGIQFFNAGLTIGSSGTYANNITVSDCRFNQLVSFFANNSVFENNIIDQSGSGETVYSFYGNNKIIQNNIFEKNLAIGDAASSIIRNNIFASANAGDNAFIAVASGNPGGPGIQFHNNIFFKMNPQGLAGFCSACEFRNNIYYLTNNPPPAGNPNSANNLNADPQFINYPALGAAFSFSYDYRLASGSPGINYGTDGKDIGMWGGVQPVNYGFEAPVPRVISIVADNSNVPAGGQVQITIKATKAQ